MKKRPYSEEDIETIKRLHLAMTWKQMSDILNRSPESICQKAGRLGITNTKVEKRCDVCNNIFETELKTKKTCSQRCHNRKWYLNGGKEIRKAYGRSTAKNRKTWRENYYINKEKILVRRKSRCTPLSPYCKQCNSPQGLERHHISYKPNIWVTLCYSCHKLASGRWL